MSQLDKWMVGGKISKLVIVITDKDTGEHIERWEFNVSNPYTMRSFLVLSAAHIADILLDVIEIGTNICSSEENSQVQKHCRRERLFCH